jgi:hypothetical protein
MTHEIASLLLPKGILDFFEITSIDVYEVDSEEVRGIYIGLEEKNELRSSYLRDEYLSKGFVPSRQVQDFPLRGLPVFLRISRRRWIHKQDKRILQNDYSYIAEGSRITQEFSDFLKDSYRDKGRTNQHHSSS